ncbi:MAG: SRPBCC domain-containing protein [Gemmatimonadaceae bacterium]|nr:SRPBCC domain-containing protein [Gemmatimonadaceae bacterium]
MPANTKSAASANPDSKNFELTITRTFNAPRDLVWKLFTEPEHLMNWMGPRGFTPMNFTQDARVGGSWRGMLHPDKDNPHTQKDLWQGGVFREVTPPERVSYTFAWEEGSDGMPGKETLVTLDFADLGEKTRLTFTQSGFTSESERDGHDGGWNSAFDKLDDYVATLDEAE